MNIILIRHGETPLNRARILQSPDTPLSDLGLRQAAAMGKRLKSEPIDAILSSDMTRADQTAQALAKTTGLPIEYTSLLHERSFGDLRGQKFSELGFDPMSPGYAPPNGETWETFNERVAQAFELILSAAKTQQRNLAVVSHGLVIREIIRSHLSSTLPVPEHLQNTAITVFTKQAPHTVSLLASAEHVDELAGTNASGGLV